MDILFFSFLTSSITISSQRLCEFYQANYSMILIMMLECTRSNGNPEELTGLFMLYLLFLLDAPEYRTVYAAPMRLSSRCILHADKQE